MLVAQQALNTFILIKVNITQNVVPLHDFIKNVKVKRQFIDTLHLLHQLSADWASDSEVVMKDSQTLSAKSMSAVNYNSRYLFANIELVSAVIAKVQPSRFVVSFQEWCLSRILFVFHHLAFVFSLLLQSLILTLIESSFSFSLLQIWGPHQFNLNYV